MDKVRSVLSQNNESFCSIVDLSLPFLGLQLLSAEFIKWDKFYLIVTICECFKYTLHMVSPLIVIISLFQTFMASPILTDKKKKQREVKGLSKINKTKQQICSVSPKPLVTSFRLDFFKDCHGINSTFHERLIYRGLGAVSTTDSALGIKEDRALCTRTYNAGD